MKKKLANVLFYTLVALDSWDAFHTRCRHLVKGKTRNRTQ